MDYLANAGCLRPLRSIADGDRLVEDLLMFQVVNRVRGPFERFVRTSEIYTVHWMNILNQINVFKIKCNTTIS